MPDDGPSTKADLGAAIAGELEDADKDDSPKGGESDDATSNESPDGGKEPKDAGGEKPDEKAKGKGADDDGEGGDDDSITLTKEELEELTRKAATAAVNEAVGKTNSTKDKEIQRLRKESEETEERLTRQAEDAKLANLPEEQRAGARSMIDGDRRERELDQREKRAGSMERLANASRLATLNLTYGVSKEELEEADSSQEQDAIVSLAKARYWERVAKGEQPLDEAASEERVKGEGRKPAKKAKKAPAGSKKETDIGGGGDAAPKPAAGATKLADFNPFLSEDGK